MNLECKMSNPRTTSFDTRVQGNCKALGHQKLYLLVPLCDLARQQPLIFQYRLQQDGWLPYQYLPLTFPPSEFPVESFSELLMLSEEFPG